MQSRSSQSSYINKVLTFLLVILSQKYIKPMSSKFWAELSSDYEKLFETEIGYDVIIYSGEEQNVKEIHAHSNILSIRSQYFRTAFSNEWAEKRTGSLFSESRIFLHNYLTSFLGNI